MILLDIWASDAGRWSMGAIGALAVAFVAWFGDRRRMQRDDPEQIGFIPWTGVFFLSLLFALVTALFALRFWLAPV